MYQDKELDRLLEISINEDIRSGDITTDACVPETAQAEAILVMKQAGIIAGLPLMQSLFKKIDVSLDIRFFVKEGDSLKAGAVIGKISGSARGILSGERIALNLIQHASGVATVTAAYVNKVSGFGCAIVDTRKTLPGLRALEKYAVRIGGGINHRFSLDDRFIIKTNHLSFIGGSDPIKEAVRRAKELNPNLPIEIEIDKIILLDSALRTDARIIILKHMKPDEVRACTQKISSSGKKTYVESSGTITLDTIRAYAATGVQGICIGALTHSVEALDIRLILQ